MQLLPTLVIIFAFCPLGYSLYNYEQSETDGKQSEINEKYDKKESQPISKEQRRRKYRKIFRAIQPPSVFENIRLGEPPSGVYIPQDSLLNVLKNYNREISTNRTQYNSYQGNNEPQYKFFFETPVQQQISNESSSYPQVKNDDSPLSRRRVAQANRRHRKPEIDALRTYPDAMAYDVQYPEIQKVAEPRSLSRSSRRRTRVQIYNEPPQKYGPSVFQNIGLGEAPEGVYIPEDSLLNILRDPVRTQSQPRYTASDLQPSSQMQPGAQKKQPKIVYVPANIQTSKSS